MFYHAKVEMSIERVVMGFFCIDPLNMTQNPGPRTFSCVDRLDIGRMTYGHCRQALSRSKT